MLGLMQSQPLLISSIITHAARHHPDAEVVSRTTEDTIHRTTYAGHGVVQLKVPMPVPGKRRDAVARLHA